MKLNCGPASAVRREVAGGNEDQANARMWGLGGS